MNKRIVAALLAGVMAFSLTACGGSGDKKGSTSDAGDGADMNLQAQTPFPLRFDLHRKH